jgi:glutaredoxin 3
MERIEIYTTRLCGYCQSAKALLRRKGVTFSEIDVTGDQEGRSRMVERANGRMTVPQIFIGSIHVGGFDDLYDLDRAGRLDPLLVMDDGPSPQASASEGSAS